MLRKLVFAAIVAGASSAAGCLLTSDFDGIVADGGQPNPGDGEVPADDGGVGDGSVSPPVDCDSGDFIVCSRFDRGVITADGWRRQVEGTGFLELDQSTSVSAPASLRSRITYQNDATGDGGAPPSATAILLQNVNVGSFQRLRWGFDLKIGECEVNAASNGNITLMAIQHSATGVVGMLINRQGDTLNQTNLGTGVGTNAEFPAGLPRARWFHLDFGMTMGAESNDVEVALDGVPNHAARFEPLPAHQNMLLNIGANSSSAAIGGCEVWFDNYYFAKDE